MKAETEKRLLQAFVALACIVPLMAGGWGAIESAAAMGGALGSVPVDLDSHFRYLSGLLLGLGIAFALCIPNIERNGLPFRMLGLIVVVGGLARLLSLIEAGQPSLGHQFGLVMELVAVPLLVGWQSRVARRFSGAARTS